MRWKQTLQTVDVHCAGEIGRVVTAGILNIPGATMAAKLHHINTVDDSLRRLLCSEPRGGPAGSVVLLTPATRPDVDIGMIVLQPDQAHAMSGSNAMCAVTALLETGMVEMIEPETTVTIDTAAGLVSAIASCSDGKVTQVSLDMPPAFVAKKSTTVLTEKWGEITYDVCYGGIFYGLVDVDQVGLTITPENARKLATTGVSLRDLIVDDLATNGIEIIHPETPEINGIAYVMFRAEEPDGAIRTCTTLRPGRVDRSPCGTGSSANLAVRYAEGRIVQGEVLRSRSIIGSEFTTELLGTQSVGPYEATNSRVSGQCWIYGISQVGLDPTDPYPLGFTLTDTWGA